VRSVDGGREEGRSREGNGVHCCLVERLRCCLCVYADLKICVHEDVRDGSETSAQAESTWFI
jgi:hypothetical protein